MTVGEFIWLPCAAVVGLFVLWEAHSNEPKHANAPAAAAVEATTKPIDDMDTMENAAPSGGGLIDQFLQCQAQRRNSRTKPTETGSSSSSKQSGGVMDHFLNCQESVCACHQFVCGAGHAQTLEDDKVQPQPNSTFDDESEVVMDGDNDDEIGTMIVAGRSSCLSMTDSTVAFHQEEDELTFSVAQQTTCSDLSLLHSVSWE